MLSLDEIRQKLIDFLRARFPRVVVDPRTDIRQLLGHESGATWASFIGEINGLAWVRREQIELSAGPNYHTANNLAWALYWHQPRASFETSSFETSRATYANRTSKPAGAAKKAKKAKKARKAAKKGALKAGGARFRTFGRPVPKKGIGRVADALPPGALLDEPYVEPEPAKKQPTPAAKIEEQTRTDLNYMLWYGTNRLPSDPHDIAKGFSGRRDTRIHHGTCKIFVPESHKIGSTGSGWWKRLITGVDDRLKVASIEALTETNFWKSVASRLKKFSVHDRDAVIFVHGYNVSFEDAALRAAQLGTDLAVKGCMAFFSWPSKATKRGYPADEASIEASESFITQFMVDFAERSGASKVHIIAHSMGNRGVLRAMNRIASTAARRTGKPFDQIILAAPDVDADTFRELCTAYAKVSRRTTLYVSSRDRAVEAAQWLHGFARAGLMPPIMIAPRIDTVNVTNADITMLGHGYVAEARGVLTDIHSLLRFGAPPTKRFGLQRQKSEDGKTYWLIGK